MLWFTRHSRTVKLLMTDKTGFLVTAMSQLGLLSSEWSDTFRVIRTFIYITVILSDLVHALHRRYKRGLYPSADQIFLMAPAGALRMLVKGNLLELSNKSKSWSYLLSWSEKSIGLKTFQSSASATHELLWCLQGSCKMRENKRLTLACNLKYSSFSPNILCQVFQNFFSTKWYKLPHSLPLCCFFTEE